MREQRDYIVQATAAGGMVRAFACTTRAICEKAREIHNSSPVVTAALGRLLTAGAMMGSMLKGERDLLTLRIKGDGPVEGLLVTADSRVHVKGYAYRPQVLNPANEKGKLDVAGIIGSGTLTIISDIGLGEPYSGQVNLISGEIAEDLTYYYANSQQTPSAVGLGVLMSRNNRVREAGGFILQLMPGCPDEMIEKLEARIAKMAPVTDLFREGRTPGDLLGLLLEGEEIRFYEEKSCLFHCDCGREKMLKALAGLGKKDLEEILSEARPVEVVCQFCQEKHSFLPEDLIRQRALAEAAAPEALRERTSTAD